MIWPIEGRNASRPMYDMAGRSAAVAGRIWKGILSVDVVCPRFGRFFLLSISRDEFKVV